MAVLHPRPSPRRDRLRGALLRRPWILPLGGSLALAFALRVPFAGVALSPDEGGVAWVAQQWGTGHGSLYGGQWLDRPPLLVALYWLVAWGGTVGVRALGAAAALALVAIVFAVAHRLGGTTPAPADRRDGARAARIAALLVAIMSASVAIDAARAPAELLAAVPSAGSILALVVAHRSGRLRPLAVAGALAVAALLIKQSFLDAGLAGAVFLVASSLRVATGGPRKGAASGDGTDARRPRDGDSPGPLRAWAAYAGGASAALVPVAVWMVVAHVSPGALWDALVTFRVESLRVLGGAEQSLPQRTHALALPALTSGLAVLVPLALVGVWGLRRDRVLAVTLAAWLTGGAVGVLGGGSYWPHYLIQLIGPAAIGAALVLERLPRRPRRAVLAVAASLAVLVSAAGGTYVAAHPLRAPDTRIAAYVRDQARPGDSFYALYARANLNAAVGLRTPFPYSWSLMLRARPAARAELLTLLRSERRPTWIVEWQRPSAWHLDPGGRIARTLRRHYRVVHRDSGHLVLRRRDAGTTGAS